MLVANSEQVRTLSIVLPCISNSFEEPDDPFRSETTYVCSELGFP